MSIANLQTLAILKSAKLAKDAVSATGPAADLNAGGRLRPEQGRSAKQDMKFRRMKNPVLLGKSCSEIGKAKDAGGHGSEKRGDNASRYTSASQSAESESRRATAYDNRPYGDRDAIGHLDAASAHEYAAKAHRLAAEVANDAGMSSANIHETKAKWHDSQERMHMDTWHGIPQKTPSVLNRSGSSIGSPYEAQNTAYRQALGRLPGQGIKVTD